MLVQEIWHSITKLLVLKLELTNDSGYGSGYHEKFTTILIKHEQNQKSVQQARCGVLRSKQSRCVLFAMIFYPGTEKASFLSVFTL